MSDFRLKVVYENPFHEEIMKVEAENTAEARAMCFDIIQEYEDKLKRLEYKNIYVSKAMLSCELIERHWKDVLMCLPKLEDEV